MKTFGLNYELAHAKAVELSSQMVTRHYVNAIKEISRIAESIKYDPNIPFEFANHPEIKAQVDKLISNLATNVKTTIDRSTKAEWFRALKKNDDLLNYIAKSSRIPVEKLQVYQNRNLDSLKSFQDRKIGGLNLSDRVWKYTNQFKGDIELGLDIGLGDGRSAAELSRDLREYLNEPAKLFRRVRDKHGILHLSKNAKKYSPGVGVYRSSYKNAMRLTRTEVNMSYRSSDYERIQELDFVVGIEIKRSNHFFSCSVCESLKGKYPKTFKFTGWHPQCRCFAVSILANQNEFIQHQKDLLDGKESELKSKNEVTEIPDNFKKWVEDNKVRIENAKNKPYFLKDNALLLKPKGHYDSFIEIKSEAEFKELSKLSKVTEEDVEILYDEEYGYFGTEYAENVNMHLRKGNASGKYDEMIEALDRVTSENELPKDMSLFRYVNKRGVFDNQLRDMNQSEILQFFKEKQGSTFVDKGYFSTSTTPNDWIVQDIHYKIYAKKGAKGYVSKNVQEMEVLLGRNSKFKIVGSKINGKSVYVELEYLSDSASKVSQKAVQAKITPLSYREVERKYPTLSKDDFEDIVESAQGEILDVLESIKSEEKMNEIFRGFIKTFDDYDDVDYNRAYKEFVEREFAIMKQKRKAAK